MSKASDAKKKEKSETKNQIQQRDQLLTCFFSQNFSVMSEYVSALGRIRHRDQTGLRPVNQRKIAKAIRRAMGLGLMPSVHRHPEILATELRAKLEGGNF